LGLTYYLTGLPQLGIAGAALAGTISLGVQASISLSSIMKTLSLKIDMINVVIKPGIGAALMVIGIKLVYAAGYMVTNNGKISTLAAIAAGALIYILVLFITGAVQQKDIEFIPNIGKPMGRILKTIGLVK
jgi:stage V sporulation protein B